ncbi:sarcoglycan beta [Calliopsis andreniformis]|uniref:sarcoglycan beta n=1 Tax=Calliopsis andreniformis TaxID=337506 RepID=UPI003FCCE3A5
MSAILDACGNDTGSMSISKAEDNLSNSDGPLIEGYARQSNCNSVRASSEHVNRTIISSHTMSGADEKSTKRRYCLWTLTFILAIIGLCNLFLNITVIAVLRISQGMEAMEVIPDENLVKFYGKTDLDRICLQSGICQSYGDEPMEIAGDEAGVQIDVNSKRIDEEIRAKVMVLPNGTTMSQVESFEVKDPRTGTIYFNTDFPNFGLPAGVEKIDVKIAETHRITSPLNENLTVNSDAQISMHGAEGATMESKDIVWSADTDILLKSVNGSIVFDGKDGVSIDVENIPVAPLFLQNPSGHEQYKVCVCMPQGKLFRVPIRVGTSSRSINCARISRTPENDPCLR